MPYKEKNIEKRYYTIGEVADMFKVATSLIRFWESEFEIIRPRKNSKGNRQYTSEDIKNIKLVYHLVKEKGYTLQGANEIIKVQKDKVKDNAEMIYSLEKIKSFLVELRNNLP
ncbi:MerR family transcriptional regulator [Cytophagaceae bacterium ABcell3]|nr:MerR family transcriptional regulator [Cytophagaceae bacterium ABcell3]